MSCTMGFQNGYLMRTGGQAPPGVSLIAAAKIRANGHRAGRSDWAAARLVMTGVVGAVLLAGCLSPAAAARRGDVFVIAPTATANEYAPALSSYDLSLLRSAGDSSTNAVAYVVNPAA